MGVPTGIVHCPVTTFDQEGKIDLETLGSLIEFHIKNNPAAICVLTPQGELFNLRPIEERKAVVEKVASVINGRVPFYVHVSASGTSHAVALAEHAERMGAKGVLVAPPYYWRLSWDAVENYYISIAEAIKIDVLGYNMPAYLRNENIPAKTIVNLIERLPNFVGLVEAGLGYQYLADMKYRCEKARPDFQIIPAVEFVLPASQMGSQTCFSTVVGIAPKLVDSLVVATNEKNLPLAAEIQHKVSLLLKALGGGTPEALKAGHQYMGRAVGNPRLPLKPLSGAQLELLECGLKEFVSEDEPRGW